MGDSNVTINIEGATKKVETLKVVNAIDVKEIFRRSQDRLMSEAIWGTPCQSIFGDGPWPSPSRFFVPEPIIPAFVAPERPAPSPEPEPVADSPAVAVLRRLLDDRQRVLANYEGDIEESLEHIADLEADLANARADLEHEKTCAAAAQTEVDQIKADIVKLGGTVAED